MIRKLILLIIPFLLVSCKRVGSQIPVTVEEEQQGPIQPMSSPSGDRSHLPRLFSNGEQLFMSWVSSEDSTDVLYYAVLNDGVWQESVEIIRGSDWFTNWADFPVIAENNGHILTSFLQKSDTATYAYDVKLNLYNAETNTLKKDFILHSDGTKSEHGFVSIRPYVGDSFFVSWLDGRNTVGTNHGHGQMNLRGAIVFKDGTIDYDTLLDGRVCDCCPTSSAIGPDDELIVAYRDRSEEEIRDISIVRWDKQNGWAQPYALGNDQWKIAGCPVNGPSIDAEGATVAAAWFSAASGEGDIFSAFSKDAGASFGPSFRLDGVNATGRVDVVLLDEKEAAVLWMQPLEDQEIIALMKVNDHGYTSDLITVATTSPERASGFPQMERVGDQLYFAWTENQNDGTSKIKMAFLSLEDI